MDEIVFWPASKRHSVNVCIRSSLHNLFPSKEINFFKKNTDLITNYSYENREQIVFGLKRKHIVTVINFF